MASGNRIAANRTNAQGSTGPKTVAGKAAAARNAYRHGVYAREALAPGEDAPAFVDLGAKVRRALTPEGALEDALCARVVGCLWRLRRVVRLESELLAGEGDPGAAALERGWLRYDEADRLRLFSQYEARLDRMLHRALHELQRHQAARSGAGLPPPLAIDIDVSGLEAAEDASATLRSPGPGVPPAG
jgi:hypothetical protein